MEFHNKLNMEHQSLISLVLSVVVIVTDYINCVYKNDQIKCTEAFQAHHSKCMYLVVPFRIVTPAGESPTWYCLSSYWGEQGRGRSEAKKKKEGEGRTMEGRGVGVVTTNSRDSCQMKRLQASVSHLETSVKGNGTRFLPWCRRGGFHRSRVFWPLLRTCWPHL